MPLIPLALLTLCIIVGGVTFWWLWTIEDRELRRDIPWSTIGLEAIDFEEYPTNPAHDPIGLV